MKISAELQDPHAQPYLCHIAEVVGGSEEVHQPQLTGSECVVGQAKARNLQGSRKPEPNAACCIRAC